MIAKSPSKDKPCSVDECLDEAKTRGFCKMHYQRFLRHGDPLIVKKGWTSRKMYGVHKNMTQSSEKHSYQDLCCLADIFPFLYDEELIGQFKID